MTRRNSTPPRPWSERMQSAGEVLRAYLSVETKLKHDLHAAQRMGQPESEKALMGKLTAAKLQTDAARSQMWIIEKEEREQVK